MMKRSLIGFMISPMVGPAVYALMTIGSGEFYSLSDSVKNFLLILIVGCPISYGLVFIFGLPLLILMKKMKKFSIKNFVLLGLIFPPLILFLLMNFNHASKQQILDDYFFFIELSICGLCMSIVFWLIAFGFNYSYTKSED